MKDVGYDIGPTCYMKYVGNDIGPKMLDMTWVLHVTGKNVGYDICPTCYMEDVGYNIGHTCHMEEPFEL